uniref:Uncharacterized protein n=1 Tax=Lactuca sativa TaxID=4236 RepID=A0A9R1UXI2_LACSA|nr:hypothetical protein LSAT_V11C700375070 [Lactuca sativa]
MASRTIIVDNTTWNNTHCYCWYCHVSWDTLVIIQKSSYEWVCIGGGIFPHMKEPDYLVCLSTSSQYQIGSHATPTMLNPFMYKLSYFKFVETDGGRGYDRVRKTVEKSISN